MGGGEGVFKKTTALQLQLDKMESVYCIERKLVNCAVAALKSNTKNKLSIYIQLTNKSRFAKMLILDGCASSHKMSFNF